MGRLSADEGWGLIVIKRSPDILIGMLDDTQQIILTTVLLPY